MIQSCTYAVDVKISSSETEINGESVGGQRYRGTKVVLRIARAKERRASNNVQFAKNLDIDGKAAKMLHLMH